MSARVLLCEDQPQVAAILGAVLRAAGFEAESLARSADVADVMLQESVAVLLISFSGREESDTTSLVTQLRGRPEPVLNQAAILVIGDQPLPSDCAVDAELLRPVEAQRLVDAVTELAATSSLVRELRRNAAYWSG
jgi:DNA-binding response OmpR family regulator